MPAPRLSDGRWKVDDRTERVRTGEAAEILAQMTASDCDRQFLYYFADFADGYRTSAKPRSGLPEALRLAAASIDKAFGDLRLMCEAILKNRDNFEGWVSTGTMQIVERIAKMPDAYAKG